MPDQNKLEADVVYHPIRGMNIDSNGISSETNECVDAVNCRILQSKVVARKGSTKLEAENDPTEDVLEYHRYVDPILGSVLFAFCANTAWRYISSAVGWQDVSNGLAAGKNFDQWSVTSAISDTVGATVVAAGSVYARPNDAQSGGGDRVLLVYDRTAGTYGEFMTLPLVDILPIVDENTTTVGPNPAATVVGPELGATDNLHPNYDPDWVFYEPGSVYFYTIQSGIIARAGETEYSIGGQDSYRLLPTNTANIQYGDTSFVRKDGSSWEMQFLTNAYRDEVIYVGYEYGALDQFYPTYVAFFHNSLIFANTYEDAVYHPWRLRWTEPGDLYKIKAGNYLDVAVGDITPILELKVVETTASSTISSFLYIYKQNAFVRGTYNRAYNQDPDLPVPLLELDEAYSEGMETVRTLEVINGQQIYLGRNDIYAFNGYDRVSLTLNPNTGASRIREYIFDNIDLDNLNHCFSVYDEIQKQYILFIKFLSDTTTYPINAFSFDMERGTWARYTMQECSAAIAADFTPNASIDSLKGNIENLSGSIEDLAGNSNKLVLLAMTTKSYIQGVGALDKIDTLGIKMFFDDTQPNSGRMVPQETLVNGKLKWNLEDTGTGSTREIWWDGAKWAAASGTLYATTHPTATGQTPPETGWDEWLELGVPTGIFLKLEFYSIGETFDSFFLTRDFVGGTLENQDRTQMLYLEGSKGSIEVSWNAAYSLQVTDFALIAERTMGAIFKRYPFSLDVTANNIRFLVRLKDGAIFRWMQVFSIRQDLTNQ